MYPASGIQGQATKALPMSPAPFVPTFPETPSRSALGSTAPWYCSALSSEFLFAGHLFEDLPYKTLFLQTVFIYGPLNRTLAYIVTGLFQLLCNDPTVGLWIQKSVAGYLFDHYLGPFVVCLGPWAFVAQPFAAMLFVLLKHLVEVLPGVAIFRWQYLQYLMTLD